MTRRSGFTIFRHMLHAPAMDTYRGPFEVLPGAAGRRLLILCDHASNAVPDEYGRLGLPEAEFRRHIAYDIGAAAVTRRLAAKLGAPAILSGFSRLLIDPNRGPDDPTLVMRLSDGAVIPANAKINEIGVTERLRRFHEPYHRAIAEWLDETLDLGEAPAILSVHSFTPNWKDTPRKWQAALLWDRDDRLAAPLIAALESEGLTVGDNEPYDGALENDTLYRHGTMRGLPHGLIEIRQDLISDAAGQEDWAQRLARLMTPVLDDPELHRVKHYGSRAGHGRRAPAEEAKEVD